jgi:hypothetical protein
MTLQEDMDSKRNWTQSEIDDLKRKYRRTHFDHFPVVLKVQMKHRKDGDRRTMNGTRYIWRAGRWCVA